MAEKRVLEVFQSPQAVLQYPWLNKPDTRYDASGIFQTKFSLPYELAQDLIAQAEKVRDAEFAKLDPQKRPTYTVKDVYEIEYTAPDTDATDEEKAAFESVPTDRVVFKAKLNAVVTPREGDSFTQKVDVVDENENLMDAAVWSGSIAMIKGQLVPWTSAAQKQVGVTFRMRAVKVLELVTGEGSDWTSFS